MQSIVHCSATRKLPGCITQPIPTFVYCMYTVKLHSNIGSYVYHILLFFHMQPTNQPTITIVATCHEKVGCPCTLVCPCCMMTFKIELLNSIVHFTMFLWRLHTSLSILHLYFRCVRVTADTSAMKDISLGGFKQCASIAVLTLVVMKDWSPLCWLVKHCWAL